MYGAIHESVLKNIKNMTTLGSILTILTSGFRPVGRKSAHRASDPGKPNHAADASQTPQKLDLDKI